MEYTLIAITSFVASLISFYSGFGLASLLMPVMAIFLPLPLAIAATAVVHFVHNSLKTMLLWKYIDWKIVVQFGSTAIIAAIPGALLLRELSGFPPLHEYSLFGLQGTISWLHVCIGLLLIAFATFEMAPSKKISIHNLYLGGALSGFLGGLSGNQGVLRSAVLLHTHLHKRAFIATNALIAIAVDCIRLPIYSMSFHQLISEADGYLIGVSVAASICAILLGMKLLKHVTIEVIQKVVVVLLYFLGTLLTFGII